MALELCSGFQARPGYVYFACSPAHPGEVKIGYSVAPASRVGNFNTTSPANPWAVMGQVALADAVAGEQQVKQWLLPCSVPHPSGRPSEIFAVGLDTVISLTQALAKEQAKARERLCEVQRAAIGSGHPDYDAIAWVRSRPYSTDPDDLIAHAVRRASQGAKRCATALRKRGVQVVGNMALLSRGDNVAIFKGSPFSFTSREVLRDTAGFTLTGAPVRFSELVDPMKEVRELIAGLSLGDADAFANA